MGDRHEQVSTFVIATVVAGVVLSVTVGAVVAVSGTTTEFDLDSASNNGLPASTETTATETTTEPPTSPAISYVAGCHVDGGAGDVGLGDRIVLDPPREADDPCRHDDSGIEQSADGAGEELQGSADSPATLAVTGLGRVLSVPVSPVL